MSLTVSRRLFTVHEYHCMAQAGILSEDDRVELIEGEIIQMAPIGSRHAGQVNRIAELFYARTAGRSIVSVQNPIRLGERSEPQPDLALLRPRPDFYAQSHPGPEDVLLLVEVAETTLEYDRDVKLPLYSQFGIPEVWLVDLPGQTIEVYRGPSDAGYSEVRKASRGQRLASSALPNLDVAIDEVLG